MLRRRFAIAVTGILALAAAAQAVITAVLPLRDVVQRSRYICVAKVEQFYPDKPAMLLSVQDQLKGTLPTKTLPVVLKGDAEAEKLNHVPQLLKRLGPDLPIVLFIEQSKEDKDRLVALAYTNGTWMQLLGQRTGADTIVWRLTHGEPYLRRTFAGTTADLTQLLRDALAGKKRLPNFNEKEEPGFGPEVK